MKLEIAENKFKAVEEKSRFKIYFTRWHRIEVTLTAFASILLVAVAQSSDGLSRVIFTLMPLAFLYWIVDAFMGQANLHTEVRDEEIQNLRRQMTEFICDVGLNRVSFDDLQRISDAAHRPRRSHDDFSLISRSWYFWKDGIGFDCQDKSVCQNCGKKRIDHNIDGKCS